MTGDPSSGPHTLAGAYALDALGGPERADFEAHLDTCEDCRSEVRELVATAARLGSAAAAAPPPGLRARVLAEAAATRQLPATDGGTGTDAGTQARTGTGGGTVVPLRRTRRAVLALGSMAAAFALVAGALGVVAWQADRRADQAVAQADRVTAVVGAPDAVRVSGRVEGGGTATVVASPTRGEIVLLAEDLPAVPEDRAYQLWLIGDEVRSAGLVATRDGRATHVAQGALDRGTSVGLTVEPAGGSQAPTTDPVLLLSLQG